MLDDQFWLSSPWHFYHCPNRGKTDFAESELMTIYRFINSFQFYGYIAPWGDETHYGVPPSLTVTNETHEVFIQLVRYTSEDTFVFVTVDGTDGQWFTVAGDAFNELLELIGF